MKEKFFVVTALVVLGLLIGCSGGAGDIPPPVPPPFTDNTCAGNGCTCGGSGCTHDSCACTTTPTDIHSHDFTTQFGLLGLSSGTNVIGDMNTRWNAAKTLDDGYGLKFYPILSDPLGTITVNSENYSYTQIYGGRPMIRFVVDGSDVHVFGSDGTGLASSITFDIAVIRSDGKGWFNPGTSTSIPGGFTPVEISPITISSITNEKINNVSGLISGGYKVYAIVRSSTRFTGDGVSDLNTHVFLKTINVIRIYPDAETP